MATGEKTKLLWQNPEYRKHMSEIHKGKPSGMLGKKNPSVNKGRKYPQISGKNHWHWKGGQLKRSGYIFILNPKHPFCNMHGYVPRSRLVMEKHLGRYLTPKEVVHHRGTRYPISSIKNRQDDRIENLGLFSNNSSHIKFHMILRYKQ